MLMMIKNVQSSLLSTCVHLNFCFYLSTAARLTADNIVKILQQVIVPAGRWNGEKCEFICRLILSHGKQSTSVGTTEEQRLREMVTFWLLKCPYASWRWLIWTLEEWDNPDLVKQLYGFAEPLTGI